MIDSLHCISWHCQGNVVAEENIQKQLVQISIQHFGCNTSIDVNIQ